MCDFNLLAIMFNCFDWVTTPYIRSDENYSVQRDLIFATPAQHAPTY
jgi:hypothetical protein